MMKMKNMSWIQALRSRLRVQKIKLRVIKNRQIRIRRVNQIKILLILDQVCWISPLKKKKRVQKTKREIRHWLKKKIKKLIWISKMFNLRNRIFWIILMMILNVKKRKRRKSKRLNKMQLNLKTSNKKSDFNLKSKKSGISF